MNLSCTVKKGLGNPLHSLALGIVNDNVEPEESVAEWCYDGFWLEIIGAVMLMQPWAVCFAFSSVSYKWKCCSSSWTFFFPLCLQNNSSQDCFSALLLRFMLSKTTAE